jgi:hypothetical protein
MNQNMNRNLNRNLNQNLNSFTKNQLLSIIGNMKKKDLIDIINNKIVGSSNENESIKINPIPFNKKLYKELKDNKGNPPYSMQNNNLYRNV